MNFLRNFLIHFLEPFFKIHIHTSWEGTLPLRFLNEDLLEISDLFSMFAGSERARGAQHINCQPVSFSDSPHQEFGVSLRTITPDGQEVSSKASRVLNKAIPFQNILQRCSVFSPSPLSMRTKCSRCWEQSPTEPLLKFLIPFLGLEIPILREASLPLRF
jgi:hypothetical protein